MQKELKIVLVGDSGNNFFARLLNTLSRGWEK